LKLTETAKRSIATWSGAGLSHRAIAKRLLAEQGLKVSHVGVGKHLAKSSAASGKPARAARSAPSPPRAPASSSSSGPSSPAPEPPDDTAEELRILRKLRRAFARQALRSDATALDQQRATTILLEVLGEIRQAKPPAPPSSTGQTTEDADAVRKKLEAMRARAKVPST